MVRTEPVNVELLDPKMHFWKWEELRSLRNECRTFMTVDQHEITLAEQRAFRERFNTLEQRVYLIGLQDGAYVGFLYLKKKDGRWWASYGVTASKRGAGYGHLLVGLSQVLLAEIEIDVLRTNSRALYLYRKMGFSEPAQQEEPLIRMSWSRD